MKTVLDKKIHSIIQKESLIERGEKVLVGVSGGIDSVTLFGILHDLAGEVGFELGVAHVNHLMRGEESEADQHFVESLCARESAEYHLLRADVRAIARKKKISAQHAGRDVRYDFFREVASGYGYEKIAVAHTMDDQVETFLLRLFKGTGIRGLSAIPVKRDNIIRPLLSVSRMEIERYVKDKGIVFREDSSNIKTVYERNFIRHEIIPVIEKLYPAFKEKVFSLLGELSAVNCFFDDKANMLFEKIAKKEGDGVRIVVDGLQGIEQETRFRILARALSDVERRFIPLRPHIELIEHLVEGKRPNAVVVLPRGIRVRRVYGDLLITKKKDAAVVKDVFLLKAGENRIPELGIVVTVTGESLQGRVIPAGAYTAFIRRDNAGGLSLRTFREGDRFVPLGMTATVKLKDFFMSRKIPREERRRVPLILVDEDIVWVVGHRIDERYKITEKTEPVLRIDVTSI